MAAKVNIGNRIYFPKNGRFYGTFYGKKFLLLYYFNHNFEDLFENDTEALKSSKENKYSIIGELSDYFKINDKFEFVLWYPTFKNHWRQSINPVYEKETNSDHDKNATGYEPLHIESTANYWGGLVYCSLKHAKGSQGALLDGSTYHVNWYYSVAPFYSFGNKTFPAAPSHLSEAALWVRIPLQFTCMCYNKVRSHFFDILLFVLFVIS